MPGSSSPPRISHDASIYKMSEAEAAPDDGKISLPDQGIEYGHADEEHARIELKLATDNYRPAYEPEAACQLQYLQRELYFPRSPGRAGMSRTDGPDTSVMSTTLMTFEERIANVRRLGYAKAETQFLSLVEERETSNFDHDRLDGLRDDMPCFSGRHFAQRFDRWETSGAEAVRAEIAAQKMPNGRFLPSFCLTTTTCLDARSLCHELALQSSFW